MAVSVISEDFIRCLPLPLAQVYHRGHRPHKTTSLEKYLAAFQLWEAALKLLGAACIAEFTRLNQNEPAIQERLTKLARPALGHWWEFIQHLVPFLAKGSDSRFQHLNKLLFKSK